MELNNFNIDLIKKPPVGLTLETNTLKIINENCYDALEYKRMIAFIGDSGFGKTKSLAYFMNKNRNVYYVVVEKSMTSRKFYIELLNILGFTNTFGGSDLNNLIKSISFHLNQSKQPNLLIIVCGGVIGSSSILVKAYL